eukprot:3444921-Rhodomonas_salina.1
MEHGALSVQELRLLCIDEVHRVYTADEQPPSAYLHQVRARTSEDLHEACLPRRLFAGQGLSLSCSLVSRRLPSLRCQLSALLFAGLLGWALLAALVRLFAAGLVC